MEIKPDKHEVYNNWGFGLLKHAGKKSGEDAERLFKEAEDKLGKCEQMKEGFAAYNWACLSSLRGDEAGCKKWLEKSKQFGPLPSLNNIMEDSDLENVRDKDWFRKFIKNLKGKE